MRLKCQFSGGIFGELSGMMEIGGFINPGGGRGSTAAFSTPSRSFAVGGAIKTPKVGPSSDPNQPAYAPQSPLANKNAFH